MSAGWGFLNTEFRNGTDAFTGAVLEGNRTPFILNLTDNVAAQYRSENSFFGRLEVIEFGNTFLNDLNTVEREAFALVRLRLGYKYEDYGFSAFVNNLFDTEYATQIFELNRGQLELLVLPEPLACKSELNSKHNILTSAYQTNTS
ncbi:MAG: hypothetical protein AAF622_08050 [Cyanobacteria bacterium P01_C01_bin.147]